MARRNPDDALTSAAPLYISIGPPCSGKTTYLRQLKESHKVSPPIVDISIDDQPDVYVPVPTSCFLTNGTDSYRGLLAQVYQGKSLQQRVETDNTELCLVLQRWAEELSPQNFAIGIIQYYQLIHQQRNEKRADGEDSSVPPFNTSDAFEVAKALISAVERFVATSPPLPNVTQVFVLESIFRRHPETGRTAIQLAHHILQRTAPHVPVAWGNTNSKPRDFQQALEVACQRRRPVYFCLYGDVLPRQSFSTLLMRGLNRLAETGKYVPAHAVSDCEKRVVKLVEETESTLVELASPQNCKYRLSSQRLIQKEYPEGQGRQREERWMEPAPRAFSRTNKRPWSNSRGERPQRPKWERR